MTGRRLDLLAGVAAGGFFAVAAVVGAVAGLAGHPVRASAAPLFGHWLPHLGPGTGPALVVAALVVWQGQALAARLSWRALLVTGYAAAVAWTLALASVDGWHRGLTGRLTTQFEYLSEVPGVTSIPAMLHGFASRIVDGGPDPWTTHVAGHPPGALLAFVLLDRAGLGGGAWAALLCVLAGSAVTVAVPMTLQALGAAEAARAAVPFLVLFPGAVWIGASADGLFTGVAAVAVCLITVGLTRRSPLVLLAGGVTLAFTAYLSYGLVLLAPLVVAVAILSRARLWLLLWALGGALAVVAAFTAGGFWWLDGYHLVQQRYYQGLASQRPYAYWVWADLAALLACTGPAAAPILRHAISGLLSARAPARLWLSSARVSSARLPLRRLPLARPSLVRPSAGRPSSTRPSLVRSPSSRLPSVGLSSRGMSAWFDPAVLAPVLLPVAAVAAILLADLSGLSKAEVERIWLPFAVWLPAGAALLPAPSRRGWLIVQAATALLINHLILTAW